MSSHKKNRGSDHQASQSQRSESQRSGSQRSQSQHSKSQGHDGQSSTCVNVGHAERELSMIGGSILAVCGLLRGSLSGLALAAVGGALIYRGHTGHCQLYAALGQNTAEQDDQQAARSDKHLQHA